jgi:hypothetical protein
MSHRSYAAIQPRKLALALVAGAVFCLGSPLVAVSSASNAGGAERPVSAGFGDCKNDNSGLQLGYVCETADDGGFAT